MISIEKCREILQAPDLTNEQASEVRETLYAIVEQLYDEQVHNGSLAADVSIKARHDESVGTQSYE